MKIQEIHESLVNGQRQQMAEQIDKYGLYDVWLEYERYLQEIYEDPGIQFGYFADAVKSYHRIKNR